MKIWLRTLTIVTALTCTACSLDKGPTLTDEESLALSRLYSPVIRSINPEVEASSSAVSIDGSFVFQAINAGEGSKFELLSVDGTKIAEASLDESIEVVLFSSEKTTGAITTSGKIMVWRNTLSQAAEHLEIGGAMPVEIYGKYTGPTPIILTETSIAIGGFGDGPRGVWSLSDGARMTGMNHGKAYISTMRLSHDETMIVCVGSWGNVFIYDVTDGAFIVQYADLGRADADTGGFMVGDAVFSPDDKTIHISGSRGWWHKMDIQSAKFEKIDQADRGTTLAISPDGKLLAFGHNPQLLWEGMSQDERPIDLPAYDTWVEDDYAVIGLTFSKDGKRLAGSITNWEEKNFRTVVWDVETRALILDYELPRVGAGSDDSDLVVQPTFSQDGQWFTVAFANGDAFVLPATKKSLAITAKAKSIALAPTAE